VGEGAIDRRRENRFILLGDAFDRRRERGSKRGRNAPPPSAASQEEGTVRLLCLLDDDIEKKGAWHGLAPSSASAAPCPPFYVADEPSLINTAAPESRSIEECERQSKQFVCFPLRLRNMCVVWFDQGEGGQFHSQANPDRVSVESTPPPLLLASFFVWLA